MTKYCQECGSELTEITVPSYSWVKCYGCIPDCGNNYVQAIDIKNSYLLSKTFPNIPKLLNESPKEKVEAAVKLINKINYKTVSIVEFEHALLNTNKGADPKQ